MEENEITEVRESVESLAETQQLDEHGTGADEATSVATSAAGADVSAAEGASKGKRIALGIGVVAALALVVGLLVAIFVLPPGLNDTQIVRDFSAAFLDTNELTNSIYASNSRYQAKSERVLSVSNNSNNSKTARVRVIFENENFKTTVEGTQEFQLVGREWIGLNPVVKSIDATPIAPVDSARVLADIDTLMSRVTPRGGVSLELLYSDANFEVVSSKLADDAKSCTLEIQADKTNGISRYAGILTAQFEFVEGKTSTEAGSWRLASVSAEDACWERSLAPIIGAWTGTFDQTSTSAVMFDTGRCFAGNDASVQLKVKSFDAGTGRMTCELSFVAHNHGALASDQSSSEGDTQVGPVELTIDLDPEDLSGSYRNEDSSFAGGTWQLTFINDSGTWKLQVRSSAAESDMFLLGPTTFTDTYILSRS